MRTQKYGQFYLRSLRISEVDGFCAHYYLNSPEIKLESGYKISIARNISGYSCHNLCSSGVMETLEINSA